MWCLPAPHAGSNASADGSLVFGTVRYDPAAFRHLRGLAPAVGVRAPSFPGARFKAGSGHPRTTNILYMYTSSHTTPSSACSPRPPLPSLPSLLFYPSSVSF